MRRKLWPTADVSSIAGAAFEVAAAEVSFSLQVSDDWFDGGAAAQFALDDTEDAALLAGDEDATGILRVVAAVSLVDIGPLDRTAGERLGAVKDIPQGVAVVRAIGAAPCRAARTGHRDSAIQLCFFRCPIGDLPSMSEAAMFDINELT